MSRKIGDVTVDTEVLERFLRELKPKAAAIVEHYGNNIALQWAQDVPYVTGDLSNSIRKESGMTEELLYTVSDGVPYGRRIELGFHGRDRLGRLYNQAAQPALVPAVESWREKFMKAFDGMFKK